MKNGGEQFDAKIDAQQEQFYAHREHVNAQKERVKEQFGRTAQSYVESESHGNPQALDILVSALHPEAEWSVLDVATGGGHVAKTLAPHVRHVTALDLTKQMLTAARNHLLSAGIQNVSYVLGDAESLPLLDDTFDAVTCRIAPHHFPNPEQFVREAARVLRPGGRFLLVDNIVSEDALLAEFYNHLEFLRDPSHVRCAPESEWVRWLGTAGFDVVDRATIVKRFTFNTWVHRMVESAQRVCEIEHLLLDADGKIRKEMDVKVTDGHVESFIGLEWMAICVKK